MNKKHNPWVALVALLLLATILVLACTGCSAEAEVIKNSDRFTIEWYFHGDAPDCYIITDNETGAQYLYVTSGRGGGLTVLQEGED